MASKSLLLALATAVAAQQTTVSLPFFGYDDQTIVASIIAVSDSLTTMSLACPTGENQNDCGLAAEQTLTVGSSSYHMYLSDADFTMTQDCTANTAMTNIVCAESAGGAAANDPGMSTTTYDVTDVAVIPVTVTAGASLLSAGAGPASTAASATGSAASQTTSGVIVVTGTSSTGAMTTAKTTGSSHASSASGSSSSSTTSSNAAMATALPALLAAGAGLLGVFL